MAIKIIEDSNEDVYLTREEHTRLYREWEASQSMTAAPVDFETFVFRQRLRRAYLTRAVSEDPITGHGQTVPAKDIIATGFGADSSYNLKPSGMTPLATDKGQVSIDHSR